MNPSTKQKLTNRLREQTYGCQGRGRREWDGQETWGCRCKLLCLERISNEVLLYSTGNYIDSLGLEQDGR